MTPVQKRKITTDHQFLLRDTCLVPAYPTRTHNRKRTDPRRNRNYRRKVYLHGQAPYPTNSWAWALDSRWPMREE